MFSDVFSLCLVVYIAFGFYVLAATVGLYNLLAPFVGLIPLSDQCRSVITSLCNIIVILESLQISYQQAANSEISSWSTLLCYSVIQFWNCYLVACRTALIICLDYSEYSWLCFHCLSAKSITFPSSLDCSPIDDAVVLL